MSVFIQTKRAKMKDKCYQAFIAPYEDKLTQTCTPNVKTTSSMTDCHISNQIDKLQQMEAFAKSRHFQTEQALPQ